MENATSKRRKTAWRTSALTGVCSYGPPGTDVYWWENQDAQTPCTPPFRIGCIYMYLQRTASCCTLGQGTSSGFSLDPEDSWNASVLQSTVNRRKWGLTKIEGFTPLMSFIGCLHFLQITTVLLLQSAISHLWSSWRICCKQKYLWQLPHSIGRISFWLQNAQCFPKSSNSIPGKRVKRNRKNETPFL